MTKRKDEAFDHKRAVAFASKLLDGNALHDDIVNALENEDESFSEENLADALRRALQKPDTNDFDAGVITAATMLRDGERLPGWLAVFAADVLEGERKRPTKRGPDKDANWIRDYNLSSAVSDVASSFCLPKYTNNELSHKTTAAQIVAEAAGVGIDVVKNAYKTFGGRIKRETSPQDSKS